MIYLIIAITLVFFFLNYWISEGDYLSPGPIFCLVFLASEIMCVIGQNAFKIKLHGITMLVLLLGFAVFTAVTYYLSIRQKRGLRPISSYEVGSPETHTKPIRIHPIWVWLLILIEIITVISFMKYLRALMVAYNVFPGTLSERIELYDKCTKFMPKLYNRLNVTLPMVYRVGNPITNAGAYILLFVIVYNFSAERKVKISHVIAVGLMCVLIVLNGSRSPLFRVLTMAFILFYVLEVRNGKLRRGDPKLLKWIIVIMIAAVIAFLVLLVVMGRADSEEEKDYFKYLFTYFGAPLVNLDTFLTHKRPDYGHQIIGSQTFRTLYNYIGKLLGIDYLRYGNIYKFAFSKNKIEIGNVYTFYYPILYDFGIFGVLPFTGFMAWYYEKTYRKVTDPQRSKKKFDFSLYVFAYLFNDLAMSFFSCRFYETIGDAPFLKLVLFSWIFVLVVVEDRLKIEEKVFSRIGFKKKTASVIGADQADE